MKLMKQLNFQEVTMVIQVDFLQMNIVLFAIVSIFFFIDIFRGWKFANL
jgi:hypothetical protein